MISDKKMIEWGIAIGGSLLLHAVVVGAFLMARSPKPANATASSTAAPAATSASTATKELTKEESSATGVAGSKDVMDAKTAMSDGDFEQKTARSTKPAKGTSRAKSEKTSRQVARPAEKNGKTEKPSEENAAERKPSGEAKSDAAKAEWKDYKVQRGESLTKIAQRCGCDIRELAKKNGLKVNQDLRLGQTIKIPVSAEK